MNPRLLTPEVKARLKKDIIGLAKPFAEKLNVPIPLILSIVKIESDFNPAAVNQSPRAMARGGAWGLMQVTFTTAKDYAERFPELVREYAPGFNTNDPNSLLDAKTNIGLASIYLHRAMNQFNGDVLKAGVSYHQGKGNIDKAVKLATNNDEPNEWPRFLNPLGQSYYAKLKQYIPQYSENLQA